LLRDYAIQGVVTFDNAEIWATLNKPMTSITATSRMLTILCVIILVAGLGSTMYVAILDRRRDIGMLRAVGMLRQQITRSVALEALILLAISALVGVPAGFLIQLYQEVTIQQVMGIRLGVNASEIAVSVALSS
jgi:putative ABC transport system permease protein